MNRYIIIMAGGVGSRFWPASTVDKPKQFLDILGIGKSLIRMTFERCLPLVSAEKIIILTNQKYKALVQAHLPEIPESNILLEPSMNNTAPCIAYAALRLQKRVGDGVMAVLPSDHVILKEKEYVDIMLKGFEFAEKQKVLVTLGIQPTRPDTGYGYIEFDKHDGQKNSGIKRVMSFKEKPDVDKASEYLSQGNYLWNAGMFIWRLDVILEAFHHYEPQITEVLSRDVEKLGGPGEQDYINKVYPLTKSVSIDYAIMEKADNVYTIPADIGWSDLGTWKSLHAYLAEEESQVTIGKNIHLLDCEEIMVRSDNEKVIVIKGLKNYIVVDESDALLIYPKSEEQDIKKVVATIMDAGL